MHVIPRHSYYGTSIDEWIARVPNELDVDAVGLWQIVPTFKESFGLTGPQLEHYVRHCVEGLLRKGALPVRGNNSRKCWELRADLVGEPEAMLEKVIAYWHALSRDPDLGDLWFALPRHIEGYGDA